MSVKYWKSIVCFFLGAPLLVFGGWRLVDPVSFFAFNELHLASDPGLLSEARATGGVVVGFAAAIVSGAFVEKLRPISLAVAAVLFFSFAAGRVFGLIADGFPTGQVMQGLVSECIMGSIALAAFIKSRPAEAVA
jgi:hypothetical protein